MSRSKRRYFMGGPIKGRLKDGERSNGHMAISGSSLKEESKEDRKILKLLQIEDPMDCSYYNKREE